MAALPTIDDVARAAQVSRQTVSNVLNSPGIVREQTRTRVEAAIHELGYRPHASARRLRTRKSFTIGVALHPFKNGISGNVLDRFLHALTERADLRGMRILLYTATDAAGEIEALRRLRDGADVDAFVLTSTFHNDPRAEWLIAERVPFVTFGRPWGIPDLEDADHLWVDVDGFAGVRDATARLLEQGARRPAFIGWPSPSGTGDERRRGWQHATADLGIDHLHREVEDAVAQGTAAALELLSLEDAPDALVCVSDSIALGAMMAASSLGRHDVPVVGYDNTAVAEAVGLSSVDQPVEEAASAALDLLFGATGNDARSREAVNEEPRHRLLAPRLVERAWTNLAPGETTGTANAGNHNRKDPS